MVFNLERIIIPLLIILIIWLLFEVIEFFRLGGGSQPLAWCIVKISVISSTVIGLSAGATDNNSVNVEAIIEKIKALPIDSK